MESLLLKTTTGKLYMGYRIVAIVMIFSDRQGHSTTVSLFKYDVSYICAAFTKISADIVRHAVPVG